MKNGLFTLLLLTFIGADAQTFDQISASNSPITGMEYFKNDNPYITVYASTPSDTSVWAPFQRMMRYQAPNAPFTGIDRMAFNDNGEWTDVQQSFDSYVLNGAGKIVVHQNERIFDYPGFSNRTKTRDTLTYNAAGQTLHLISYEAIPATSNNYERSYEIYLLYDSNGIRIKDSLVYEGGAAFLTYYLYDSQGNILQETMMEGADTSGKTIIRYNSNNLIISNVQMGFDNASDEWTIYAADTFEYNSNNLVSKHIGYGMLFINGNVSFGPFMNEVYTYTNTSKIESITRFNSENDEWIPATKTSFMYGANGKPYLGYTYTAEGTGWGVVPTEKYLFDDFITALPSVAQNAEVRIFPNPVNEVLYIETANKPTTLVLTDMNGHAVLEGTYTGNSQVSTSTIPNGMYFLSIRTNQGIQTQRIVIKH